MVWAQSLDGVIGLDGGMPWEVPEDLQHFKKVTMGEVLVMGRRTWSSFPNSVRPLPGRTSIVVSKSFSEDPSDPTLHHEDVYVVEDFDKGLKLAAQLKTSQTIWVAGGGTLYDQAIDVATVIERSLFNLTIDGDTYAPELDGSWTLAEQDPVSGWHISKSSVEYRFERWERSLE